MTKLVLVQSSLRKEARTAVVMELVAHELKKRGIDFDYLDLRDYTIPFCDGRSLIDYYEEYPDVEKIQVVMAKATAFVFGFPNYVYSYSGVFKNFLDIFGKTTKGKYYGIVINAGGKNGYMASDNLLSIMHFDFNASAIMPQVYTAKDDFELVDTEWILVAQKPRQKVVEMIESLLNRISTPPMLDSLK